MPLPSPSLYPSSDLYSGEEAGPTTFTEGILNSLAPWLTPRIDPQGAHLNQVTALAAMFEQVFAIVADQGSPDEPASYQAGWSTLLDPSTCPTAFLPYLAQFIGASVPPGTEDATARAIIRSEQGFQRGTPGAIVAAAQRFLTGT
jgi:Phage tail protein (Tail_P2_I)